MFSHRTLIQPRCPSNSRRLWNGKQLYCWRDVLWQLYTCIDLPDPGVRLRELSTCPFVLATNIDEMTIIDELHAPHQRYAATASTFLFPGIQPGCLCVEILSRLPTTIWSALTCLVLAAFYRSCLRRSDFQWGRREALRLTVTAIRTLIHA